MKGLNFEQHIRGSVKKANKVAGMITHCIRYKCKEVKLPRFKFLVRPVLEYGNVEWSLSSREKYKNPH